MHVGEARHAAWAVGAAVGEGVELGFDQQQRAVSCVCE